MINLHLIFRSWRRDFLSTVFALLLIAGCSPASDDPGAKALADGAAKPAVLVYSRTEEFRHDSIPAGIAAIEKLGARDGFAVTATEDPAFFTDANLSRFAAIVFLNTTGNVLDRSGERAMERFIQAGGGFVGIHSAADTEWRDSDWFWYRRLLGAVFKNHTEIPSNVQTADLRTLRWDHPATARLPEYWSRADEWYNFRQLSTRVTDLVAVDESSYIGGEHGARHPMSWYQEFDGGRSFYTAMGHTVASFAEPEMLEHLSGGIRYAIGDAVALDYTKARPESSRFYKQVLAPALAEPVGFDIASGGEVFIAERRGTLKRYDPATRDVAVVARLGVEFGHEFGLLAVALAPDFAASGALFLMYNQRLTAHEVVQRVARFTLDGANLDLASETVLLEIAVDEHCCHTGGDLEFDDAGNLFIAIGDNTNAQLSQGYAPIDSRADMSANDARRTSANTQSLSGKILRIRPRADGGYAIPAGNLFADPERGRPEIYVMGTRNPYTLAYDDEAKMLYFADVGPDARAFAADRGAGGHDEINRVAAPGNYGWPFFVANNRPYRAYDFAAAEAGGWFDPLAPRNASPRNTGAEALPPAQPALIWYPYRESERFPELGGGGRNALVAEVFRPQRFRAAEQPYPDYYAGKLFIADFVRRWIKVVSLDPGGRVSKIEPFAAAADFAAPLDLKFGPDGHLYVLEYGAQWFTANPDARLAKVAYSGPGNRPPRARLAVPVTEGAAPFTLAADAGASADPDGDPLTFAWQVTALDHRDQADAHLRAPWVADPDLGAARVRRVIDDIGLHLVRLRVADDNGASAEASALVHVGNAPPQVAIAVDGNRSFFWPGRGPLRYDVNVRDAEDGALGAGIEAPAVAVGFAFHPPVDTADGGGGHPGRDPVDRGAELVSEKACVACHQARAPSVGPSFAEIAARYAANADAERYLVDKIKRGGAGVWGAVNMPAHDFLPDADVRRMVAYLLSLADDAKASLAASGDLPLDAHVAGARKHPLLGTWYPGTYRLRARYADRGANGLPSLVRADEISLRHALVPLYTLASSRASAGIRNITRHGATASIITGSKTYLALGRLDLSGIAGVRLFEIIAPAEVTPNTRIELRAGGADGQVVGVARGIGGFSERLTLERVPFEYQPREGMRDLYLVFHGAGQDDYARLGIFYAIEFLPAER